MTKDTLQDKLGQLIANSFYGMEAGYTPTESFELPVPSSGDLQIAFDILYSEEFDRWLRAVKAEAWDEGVAIGYDFGHREGTYSMGYAPPEGNPYRN